ncbi:VWA domain-containing protein [Streptomyces sp. C8S0]|uniref:VWA domain-containing protein n=1 Tax=Streptomyces sp. C8S0 TaxID=2585716 RepID=UPI001D038F81|nr:VWA domain-containing protein [Streptomyces sp. C8S0]
MDPHRAQAHPTPPLRVGIAVDVSGSMSAAAAPIASAAWIVAKATALTDPDSRTATVAYDHAVTAITFPGRTPARVNEFRATGMGHSLAEAIDALTAGVDLLQPGAGRLLVIASDGYYHPTEAAHAAQRITALRKAGCAVLWLAFDPDPSPCPAPPSSNSPTPPRPHPPSARPPPPPSPPPRQRRRNRQHRTTTTRNGRTPS